MALRISSFFMNQGREDSRISGLLPNAATKALGIYGGMVITQDPTGTPTGDGRTFKFFDGSASVGATNPFALGLVIEPTVGANNGPANGDSDSGQGFDSVNYGAFGGVYSAIQTPGMIIDAYDDLRNTTPHTVDGVVQNVSCPFLMSRAYAIGDIISVAAHTLDTTTNRGGLLTNLASIGAGSLRVGFLRGVNQDDSGNIVLSIELNMEIVYA